MPFPAETGFIPAIFRMATMYYQGEGTARDLARAYSIYRELADSGEADAIFMVGRMLLEGLGVEKDEESIFVEKHVSHRFGFGPR